MWCDRLNHYSGILLLDSVCVRGAEVVLYCTVQGFGWHWQSIWWSPMRCSYSLWRQHSNVRHTQIPYTYIGLTAKLKSNNCKGSAIYCSNWSSCTANAQNAGCTYYDMFTEALQYSWWSSLNDYNLIQQRYRDAVDSLDHLCNNIYPGILLTTFNLFVKSYEQIFSPRQNTI